MLQTPLRRNFYGRIKGKTLNAAQQRYLSDDLPLLALSGVEIAQNPARIPLDIERLFGGRDVWLEIGFGSGEHLIHQAKHHPDVAFIGVEPYMNGVASLLSKIHHSGVQNINLHMGDARDLLDVLPSNCLQKAFLLYPDPWPKARHHRRRFVTAEHLIPLRQALAQGAELRIATDIADYVRQTLQEVSKAGFFWHAWRAADWRQPWADWQSTRYEQKALREGRKPYYLTFAAQ